MNIRKHACAVVIAGVLGALAAPAEAAPKECKADDTRITSSLLVSDGWYISGECLENVTNVSLARDDGAGFDEMSFTPVTNAGGKTSLLVGNATRQGPGLGGIPYGQYLVQLKKCTKAEKCKVLDEKYLFVLLGSTPT